MLPSTSAMPSAGSTVPRTSPAGTLTTAIISPVRVSTLTRMLNARPKKAFVSPRVHQGTVTGRRAGAGAVGLAVLMTGLLVSHGGRGGGGEGGEERGGGGDPAEDAALGADHLQADAVELGEVRADAVGQHEAVEAAVVGLADGGVHADLGGHPGDDEVRDLRPVEQLAEAGRVEGALAGLVDDRLAGDRGQLVDDVVAVLAADEDAAVGAGVADPLAGAAP